MSSSPSHDSENEPRHRSGAVARMVRMPVATLRVWERRYRLSSPAMSPSGQRLYSAADVRRIALLKQLTDLGHAIGTLAGMDMAGLQDVAATHAGTVSRTLGAPSPVAAQPLRVAVVGPVLAQRLGRPGVRRQMTRPLQIVGPFTDVASALAALDEQPAEIVLVHSPSLHADGLGDLRENAVATLSGARLAAVYRFAAEPVCQRLAGAGVALLREPLSDAALGQWLAGLAPSPVIAAVPLPDGEPIPARRWDDAALIDIAGLSSTIACECPRHIAELLMQLTQFEAYSAECAHRSPADAELHGYLGAVTASARARFEEALERVARHEGLPMGPR